MSGKSLDDYVSIGEHKNFFPTSGSSSLSVGVRIEGAQDSTSQELFDDDDMEIDSVLLTTFIKDEFDDKKPIKTASSILGLDEAREIGAYLLGYGLDPEDPEALLENLVNEETVENIPVLIEAGFDKPDGVITLLNVAKEGQTLELYPRGQNPSESTPIGHVKVEVISVDYEAVYGATVIKIILREQGKINHTWTTCLPVKMGTTSYDCLNLIKSGGLDKRHIATTLSGDIQWLKGQQ